MATAITHILKQTRTEILSCLKNRGEMSVEQIASLIGVSKVCIRRHLELLGRDGLVAFKVEKHERGRPGHVYYLTEKSECLFPTRYNAFAVDVLRQVEGLYGGVAVSRVINGQANELLASLKPQLNGLSFDERVKKMCALINERGYDIAVRKLRDGSYLVKQRNCPVVAVATKYEDVCKEELRLYRDLIGTEVVRECRIAAGARSCDYRILPPGSSLSEVIKSAHLISNVRNSSLR